MEEKLVFAIRDDYVGSHVTGIPTPIGNYNNIMCGGEDGGCRPLGFLLGLPFAFISLLLSLAGVVLWILGCIVTCVCPCCVCVTWIVDVAVALIKAPFSIIVCFTDKIPC
ncbi:unnamed protein product [Cuscuta campestris]|uniref:Uncharacterized protein n=2 Tax=Cuscuta sect. Cleistogrammica TaxID=1824901 RepID=A0A484MJ22_9ASTE|nr:unnamed protein product [Cuscuta campestris]